MKASPQLQQIYDDFVNPLVEYFYVENHPLLSDRTWIIKNLFFHHKDRSIVEVEAQEDFKIPGLCATTPHNVNHGGSREVKAGERLWVRFDKSNPTRYDLEFVKNNKIQVFQLSSLQWRKVKLSLKRKRRQHPALRGKSEKEIEELQGK